ncbi:imidazoleglycerol-phosphate dehydratase HisB [Candidatus Gottesmanbacteria bacterium]|nr:imidazoleglycerol-phosphate dehydratase HisB [Candidatus Gottesmanbacteria bacterium]
MKKREVTITRETKETKVKVYLNIDGSGRNEADLPAGFLSHMLDLFAKHGLFDLKILAKGDLQTDEHHLIEDIGFVLGQAFSQVLGDKAGIKRYGFFILPMDEVLTTVAVDFSGRCTFNLSCQFSREKVGDLPTELIYDFWDAFAQNAKVNLFIKVENGRNDHHKIEAIFKACARAIRMACEIDKRLQKEIPSTKGVL